MCILNLPTAIWHIQLYFQDKKVQTHRLQIRDFWVLWMWRSTCGVDFGSFAARLPWGASCIKTQTPVCYCDSYEPSQSIQQGNTTFDPWWQKSQIICEGVSEFPQSEHHLIRQVFQLPSLYTEVICAFKKSLLIFRTINHLRRVIHYLHCLTRLESCTTEHMVNRIISIRLSCCLNCGKLIT